MATSINGDRFARFGISLITSPEDYDVITQASWSTLRYDTRAITVGTPGTLNVRRKSDGVIVTIPQAVFAAQATILLRATELIQAGSTADNILVSY